MARPLRIEYPGAVYHITARGNQKLPIFLDNTDRSTFLSILGETCHRYNWFCYAYCLMDNHYHLVIETVDGILSLGMALLNGKYTQKFNFRQNKVGHVFQGRYKAILVDREKYLLELIRYVSLNPVRAKMVSSPDKWKHSSYLTTVGRARNPGFLSREWILDQFDQDYQRSIKAFKTFVEKGISLPSPLEKTHGNAFLGDKTFIKKAMKFSRGRKRFKDIPKVERFADRPNIKAIFSTVTTNIEKREAIYRAHIKFGYKFIEIARYLKVHSSTVSRALQKYLAEKEARRNSEQFNGGRRKNV